MMSTEKKRSNSRRVALVLPGILLLGAAGVFFWFERNAGSGRETPVVAVSPRSLPGAGDVSAATVSGRAFSGYQDPSRTMRDDLELVEKLLRQFFRAAKSRANRYPMGTNREIVRVLAGHNPMGHGWIPRDHPAINEGGELIDRWGGALHFHGLGNGVFEIRSAGGDATLFTGDDIVVGGGGRTRMALDQLISRKEPGTGGGR